MVLKDTLAVKDSIAVKDSLVVGDTMSVQEILKKPKPVMGRRDSLFARKGLLKPTQKIINQKQLK
jgi:hypothetical protein